SNTYARSAAVMEPPAASMGAAANNTSANVLIIHPSSLTGYHPIRGRRTSPIGQVRICDHVGSMPTALHVEKHFEASDTVRDVVIGMADGLTVPFALAAGLTGTVAATAHLVVIAGLAEIAAGSIAMGLGGYLAARTDRDHFLSEREREIRETVELPDKERDEVAE